MGRKTAQITAVVPSSAPWISFMAAFAASLGFRLLSCSSFRSTFSVTTIASSTSIPIAKTRAKSVNTLIEYPNARRKAKVPSSTIGIVMAGIKVARTVCRKTKMTSTTRATASESVNTTF